jgi:cbb3-type cytochrome oxidase subunit 1
MHIIPHTRQEWGRFILFPFRAFVVVAPICLLIWLGATEGHRIRGARAEAAFPVALGLILCVHVFLVAALIQLMARRREAAFLSFAFGFAAFLVMYLLLPMCAT